MLDLRHIFLERDRPILKDISYSFSEGTVYGIIGKSGAGKTSLLKIAAGLLDAGAGEIIFDGKRLPGPSEKLIPGHEDIQLVNQDFALEPYHTVEENIREKILARHRSTQKELITEFLDLLELGHLRAQKALYLSGGEQQRLALARALACEPRVLLLDEPFVHLDQRLRWKVQDYLKEVNRVYGTVMVLVSHDGSEMMGFAETVLHLRLGEIVRSDAAESVYFRPDSREEAELMGPVNRLVEDGTEHLFRPNEYELSEHGHGVRIVHRMNTGNFWLNTGRIGSEEVWLQSADPLEEHIQILIRKKG